MLGSQCSPCCGGCKKCAQGQLPKTITVTLDDYKGVETPADSGCYPCDCHAGERRIVLRQDDDNKCRYSHYMCLGDRGPDLLSLSIESSCFGSGAAAHATAPGGIPSVDNGGISGVTVDQGGSGYAVRGRAQPTATVATAGACSVPVSVTWLQPTGDCGLSYWTATAIALNGSASGCACVTIGDRLQIVASGDGAVTDQYAEIEVTDAGGEPTIVVVDEGQQHGSAAFSVTLAARGETPERWRIASVTVVDGGDSFADGQQLPAMNIGSAFAFAFSDGCGRELTPATAFIYCVREKPNQTEVHVTSEAGSGAVLEAAYATTPTPDDTGHDVWAIESVTVTSGGSGYAVGDNAYLYSTELTQVVAMLAHVRTVDESGAITAVTVDGGGKYFRDTHEAAEVVVVDGGSYVGGTELLAIKMVGGGRMYQESNKLPAIAADVTVTINQTYPSEGTGAVLRPIISLDPTAGDFGTITSIAVDAGGSGYLLYSTQTRKPVSVEYFGPDHYVLVTVDRENECSYSMKSTASVQCDDFSFNALNADTGATASVEPGGVYHPSFRIEHDNCCGICCDSATGEQVAADQANDCTYGTWRDTNYGGDCQCGVPGPRFCQYGREHPSDSECAMDGAGKYSECVGNPGTTGDGLNHRCPDPPQEGDYVLCCGESVSGYLLSPVFHFNINTFPCPLTPKAKIYANSAIDDTGSVGGVAFRNRECVQAILDSDTIVNAEVHSEAGGGFRLRVPYTANNGVPCGPYGCNTVMISWYFERNDGC